MVSCNFLSFLNRRPFNSLISVQRKVTRNRDICVLLKWSKKRICLTGLYGIVITFEFFQNDITYYFYSAIKRKKTSLQLQSNSGIVVPLIILTALVAKFLRSRSKNKYYKVNNNSVLECAHGPSVVDGLTSTEIMIRQTSISLLQEKNV